jgi:hypothetical protein
MREPRLICVTGRKGVGKTFTTMKYLNSYVQGNPQNGVPGRKVLIFDVNDEYTSVRAIYMKDVIRFSARPVAEIRRIRPFFDTGEKMTLDDMATVLQWIVQNFFKGLLLIEDINKYVGDNMPGDLIGAVCTNRHTETDIILHYQSNGRITPKVWQNINVLRMHKNTDSVERHEKKFPDKYEMMLIAERIVNNRYNSGDKRYYLWVDFDDEKIHPGIPVEEIKKAITEFVMQNQSSLVAPLVNMRDRTGKRQYNFATACDFVEARLLDQYFVTTKTA